MDGTKIKTHVRERYSEIAKQAIAGKPASW
jgi:hypothetical protein